MQAKSANRRSVLGDAVGCSLLSGGAGLADGDCEENAAFKGQARALERPPHRAVPSRSGFSSSNLDGSSDRDVMT